MPKYGRAYLYITSPTKEGSPSRSARDRTLAGVRQQVRNRLATNEHALREIRQQGSTWVGTRVLARIFIAGCLIYQDAIAEDTRLAITSRSPGAESKTRRDQAHQIVALTTNSKSVQRNEVSWPSLSLFRDVNVVGENQTVSA